MQQTSLRDEPQTDWSVVPVALAFGLGLGALGWWLTKEEPGDAPPPLLVGADVEPPAAAPPRRVMAAASSSVAVASAVTLGADPAAASTAPASSPEAPVLSAALQALAQEFGPPVTRTPTQRPPFMNANEWDLIANALRQGSQTDEEAAGWINTLRFRRLLARWQSLPLSADPQSPRAHAARLLLQDIRPRLAANGVNTPTLRAQLPDILRDAIANPAERQQTAQALAEAINQAQGDNASVTSPPEADAPPRR